MLPLATALLCLWLSRLVLPGFAYLGYSDATAFLFFFGFLCKRDFWITTSSVAKKGVGVYLTGGFCPELGDIWPRLQGALTPLQGCSKRSRTDAADEECLACFA